MSPCRSGGRHPQSGWPPAILVAPRSRGPPRGCRGTCCVSAPRREFAAPISSLCEDSPAGLRTSASQPLPGTRGGLARVLRHPAVFAPEESSMPQLSDMASTMRSPRPVRSLGVGERGTWRPFPVSRERGQRKRPRHGQSEQERHASHTRRPPPAHEAGGWDFFAAQPSASTASSAWALSGQN